MRASTCDWKLAVVWISAVLFSLAFWRWVFRAAAGG